MQIENNYNELCELFQKEKRAFVELNKASLELDVRKWNKAIDEYNHIDRQINNLYRSMITLRNINFDEMKRRMDKYFVKAEQ